MSPNTSTRPSVTDEVVRQANAKINLFLRVLGRRKDEYHEVETLIAPISLADEVTCRKAKKLLLHLDDPSLPAGPDNLAIVAALALAEACGGGAGADIGVHKRIPVAAGLGGGSADAAAVLSALNELWECNLGADALRAVGTHVGSDVPALLAGRPVVARGRGERLEPAAVPPLSWVIVPFEFRIRTPEAYRWWDDDGAKTGPDPSPVIEAAASGDAERLAGLLFNDLEEPVIRRHPEVGEAKSALVGSGALSALVCGSGPTVAGLVASEEEAGRVASSVPSAIVVTSLG